MKKKNACRIALGADHGGYLTKKALVPFLKKEGFSVVDMGAYTKDAVDYPDLAFKVSRAVASGRCDKGILMCGTGIGMSIAANKVKGIRAAVCWSVATAKLASEHNWSHILCLSGRFTAISIAKKMVKTWLKTAQDESVRHARRVRKIAKIEAKITS